MGYWCGDLEYFYREAVLYRNNSAYQAFESYQGRDPFIWKDASLSVNTGDGPAGQGLERLVVGSRFQWMGEAVHVTSFRDGDNPAVVACSYTKTGDAVLCETCKHQLTWPKPKLLHRFRITQGDLSDARKVLKIHCIAQKAGGSPIPTSMEKAQQHLFRSGLPWGPSFKKMQTPDGVVAGDYVIKIEPKKAEIA